MKKTFFKRGLEELMGIVFISAIVLLIGISYLTSLLKKPYYDDFGWSSVHLEYTVQVFMGRSVFVEGCGKKSMLELIIKGKESEEQKPCQGEDILPAREIVREEIKDFFNSIKNDRETFFISINTGNWVETISIDGIYGNKTITFEQCIKNPYSLVSSFPYSLNLKGYSGYIKFSYCKYVK
jgi:hypothetical protein